MKREIYLEIGPFKENENPGTSKGIIIRSNGSLDTLKVKAQVYKSIVWSTNRANILIWNLNQDTRALLQTAGLSVNLFVSKEEGQDEILFSGGIRAVVVSRQGADIVTRLVCYTAHENILNSFISASYKEGIPLNQIVKEIAEKIPNITVDPTNIKLKGKVGYKGWVFAGNASDALTKLGLNYGFSWNIDDGVLFASMDGKSEKKSILLTSDTGLMKVSPRLTGQMAIQEGVDIQAIFRPGITPGHLIRVESSVNPNMSDTKVGYMAHTIEYDLCPKDNSWEMNMTTFFEFGSEANGL